VASLDPPEYEMIPEDDEQLVFRGASPKGTVSFVVVVVLSKKESNILNFANGSQMFGCSCLPRSTICAHRIAYQPCSYTTIRFR